LLEELAVAPALRLQSNFRPKRLSD
jgi:hypothetical protein